MNTPTDYEISMEIRAIEAEEIAKARKEYAALMEECDGYSVDTGGERIVKWLGAAAWFTAGVAVVVALALVVGYWRTR
jgi:hypothetical protein